MRTVEEIKQLLSKQNITIISGIEKLFYTPEGIQQQIDNIRDDKISFTIFYVELLNDSSIMKSQKFSNKITLRPLSNSLTESDIYRVTIQYPDKLKDYYYISNDIQKVINSVHIHTNDIVNISKVGLGIILN